MKDRQSPKHCRNLNKTLVALLGCCVWAVGDAQSQELRRSEEGGSGPEPAAAHVTDDAAPAGFCNFYDDDSVIDLLVLYTALARDNNSSADIQAYIRANVDTMNEILENSGVYPRMRVVHTQEVTYNESGFHNNTTMDRLLDPSDGFLDDVPALRDAYQADLVALIARCVNCGGVAACNRGDEYIVTESGGYAVISADWPVTFPWGMAHELAHTMGCGHNRDAENVGPGLPRNCRFYPYSYGWDFVGDGGQWHSTVMSYGPTLCGGTPTGNPCVLYDANVECPFGQTCQHLPPPKIPYFSNPAVLFDGQPTGVPVGQPDEANCALTLNQTAFTVANFRRRAGNIWIDFPYLGFEFGCFEFPYNTLSEGISAVPDHGAVIFKAGSTPETALITKAVTLKAYGGAVRIGE